MCSTISLLMPQYRMCTSIVQSHTLRFFLFFVFEKQIIGRHRHCYTLALLHCRPCLSYVVLLSMRHGFVCGTRVFAIYAAMILIFLIFPCKIFCYVFLQVLQHAPSNLTINQWPTTIYRIGKKLLSKKAQIGCAMIDIWTNRNSRRNCAVQLDHRKN